MTKFGHVPKLLKTKPFFSYECKSIICFFSDKKEKYFHHFKVIKNSQMDF